MKTVEKVWGNEEWIVNRDYCGKILNLNKGFRCSLHYHKNKDETFYVLEGKVLMEIAGKNKIMHPGDVQLVEPGQKHRFTGLIDSKILEFSTHHEDEDSYRDEVSGKIEIIGEKNTKINDFSKIKLLVCDFDGVMTDNKVAVDENGKESVICDRGDGLGIENYKKMGEKF